jgi:ribulose 1,5-bisphosphate carboxylase large subunit-like protein
MKTVHLINACTNSKIPVPQGEKEVNMSSGFERFVQHQREEAAAEAAAQAAIQASVEAWQDVDLDREDILERLQKKYKLDEATAAKYYEQFSVDVVV